MVQRSQSHNTVEAAATPPAEALKHPRSEPSLGGRSSDEARQSHVVTPAQALRELFDAADADGSGTLEAEEIAKFCEELRPSKEMSAREVALAMAAMGAGDAPGGHVTREQFETWWWTAGYRTLEERAEFASAAGRADRRQSLHALFRTLPATPVLVRSHAPTPRCVQMSSTRTPAAT